MQRNRTTSKRKSLGQGMTEYIIIVALIAIASIAAFSYFGGVARKQMAGLSQELSGKTGSTQITAAQGDAAKAAETATTDKDLGTYDKNNIRSGGTTP